jgi:multidrug efflux pump subunit AcrA (membrane-fusion protein)
MYRNGRPGFGLVALALLGLSGCGNQDQPPAPPRTVETILAVSTSDLADAVYPGQVVSRFAIDYGFRVGGMLVARPVEVGQYVEAGTVLARLDPSDAEINLRGATAQAQAAAITTADTVAGAAVQAVSLAALQAAMSASATDALGIVLFPDPDEGEYRKQANGSLLRVSDTRRQLAALIQRRKLSLLR